MFAAGPSSTAAHGPAVKSWLIRRGNGLGSVPHQSAIRCWTMVPRASVLSTHRCSLPKASTRRIAMTSVSRPNSAPKTSVSNKESHTGKPSPVIIQAPNTPPSMAMWPVVSDST